MANSTNPGKHAKHAAPASGGAASRSSWDDEGGNRASSRQASDLRQAGDAQQAAEQQPSFASSAQQRAGTRQNAYQEGSSRQPSGMGDLNSSWFDDDQAPSRSSYSSAGAQASQRAAAASTAQGRRGQYVAAQDDASNYHADRYVRRKRGSSTPKRVAKIVGAVLAVYLIALGVTGALMYFSVDGIKGDVARLKSQMLKGDYAAAQESSQTVASKLASLDGYASNPVMGVATVVPFVGSDVKAVRGMAHAGNLLCSDVLVPLTESLVASGAGPLIGDQNNLNADALEVCFRTFAGAQGAANESRSAVERLDSCAIGQVDSARRSVRTATRLFDTLSEASEQLAARVHWLLGADGGQRTYLIAAQNNVELRANGGYTGSFGPMFVTDGILDVGDFVSGFGLGRFDTPNFRPIGDGSAPAPDISGEELRVFGTRVTWVPCEYGFNPDFTVAAPRWKYVWSVAGYGDIDGVVALDPVFLQKLLGLVGGVTTGNGTVVDGENAAHLLMYDTYRNYGSADQDAFFAEVAKLAFHEVVGSLRDVDMVELLRAFASSANDGRLIFWFDDIDSESAFGRFGWTGALSHDATAPVLGVYYNDDVWGKMSWYLSTRTRIGQETVNPDGSRTYQVTSTMKNNIDEQEGASLPSYVKGHNPWCGSDDGIVAWVHLFAPEGGKITNVTWEGDFLGPDTV
ncbi:MAG: DUF4012 domain-containing protein, partial [Eggerthellaceae bacterium]|nr:DUF4012 domain-containing protein [Eggerthellaceae bacterium]